MTEFKGQTPPLQLNSPRLCKKFPVLYGTETFIKLFTTACHLSLSWARLIQSYVLNIWCNIILQPMPSSSKSSLSLKLPHQKPVIWQRAHILSHYLISRCITVRYFQTSTPIHTKVYWIQRSVPYTGCNRRNGPDFGRVFLMLNYTEKPQNTYIQSSMFTEI